MEFNFLRQAPFLRLSICLIAGIVAQYYSDLSLAYPWLASLSLLLIGASYIRKLNRQFRWRWLAGAGYTVLCFVIGGFLTGKAWEKSAWEIAPEYYNYKVRVLDDPIEKAKTWQYKVKILAADSLIHDQVAGKQALLYLPKQDAVVYPMAGDCLLVEASLEIPKAFQGAMFDYPLYLRKQSFAAVGFVKPGSWQIVDVSSPWYESITYKALQVRRASLERLKGMLPGENHYALSAALFFGYQSDMDKGIRQQFANTGVGHILSVSGVHFSILFGIVFFLLTPLGMSTSGRILRLLISLPLIWGFAFVTGFSPPVTRSACMATVWIVGAALSRESLTLNTVAIAAFFMLLHNPLYLFDISFQLSFSAVVAIVLLNPYLRNVLMPDNRILVSLWDLSCVSLTAQAGVLPLSVYYFHTFPLLFLVANLLIMPFVSVLMLLIPLSLGLSFLFSIESLPLMDGLLAGFLKVISALDGVPRGVLSGIHLSQFDVLLSYFGLFFLSMLLIKKRVLWLYLALSLVIIRVLYYLCQPEINSIECLIR